MGSGGGVGAAVVAALREAGDYDEVLALGRRGSPALDLLDEISNQLPGELKQAKTIVASRNEVIPNAKREAENILKQAAQRAKQMISREEVVKQAEQQSAEMMKAAQQKIKELRQVTNDYVDDAMNRTEDAISQSLSEIRESRSKFRTLVNPQAAKPSPIIEDV